MQYSGLIPHLPLAGSIDKNHAWQGLQIHERPGTESRSVTGKLRALPSVLSLWSHLSFSFLYSLCSRLFPNYFLVTIQGIWLDQDFLVFFHTPEHRARSRPQALLDVAQTTTPEITSTYDPFSTDDPIILHDHGYLGIKIGIKIICW